MPRCNCSGGGWVLFQQESIGGALHADSIGERLGIAFDGRVRGAGEPFPGFVGKPKADRDVVRDRRIAGQQRSKTAQRVRLDIRINLRRDQAIEIGEPLRRDLGKRRLQDGPLKHDPHGSRWIGQSQELQQFVGNAFARQRHQVVGARRACLECGFVRLSGIKARMETKEPQDAQMILGDALKRIPDEADVPLLKVVKATEIIEQFAGQRICGQGVDREIPARRILLPIVGESDRRPAAIGRHISAQRSDLERMPVADRGHRAVIDAGWHGFDLGLFKPSNDLVWRKPGREVDIVDGEPEQIVTDRTADVAGQPFLGTERGE